MLADGDGEVDLAHAAEEFGGEGRGTGAGRGSAAVTGVLGGLLLLGEEGRGGEAEDRTAGHVTIVVFSGGVWWVSSGDCHFAKAEDLGPKPVGERAWGSSAILRAVGPSPSKPQYLSHKAATDESCGRGLRHRIDVCVTEATRINDAAVEVVIRPGSCCVGE